MLTHRYEFREFLNRIGHQSQLEKFEATIAKLIPFNMENGPWLCGGAVRDAVAGKDTDTDWDIFCKSESQVESVVACLKKRYGDPDERPNNLTFAKDGLVVQVIRITTYPSIEAALDSFDFTICQFAYASGQLVVGQFSLFDLCRKRLALHRLTYGVSTLRRLMKYSAKGFTVCPGVLADILLRTVENPRVINPDVVSVD